MPTLIHYKLCPFSRSVRLTLAEMGMDVELREEMPWEWRPDFLAINPAGDLPVLMLEGGSNLCGTYSISEFLNEATTPHNTGAEAVAEQSELAPEAATNPTHPAPPAFKPFPDDREDRAEARRLVDWFHGKCHRETTSFLLQEKVHARFQAGQIPAPDGNVIRAAQENLGYHMSYLNLLADQRNWLAGDSLSFADFAAAAHLSCLDYLSEVRWDDFPSARTWYQRLKSRKAFRSILDDRIPGMPPPAHYADLDF